MHNKMVNVDTAPNKRRFPSVYAGTTAPLKKTLDHHHNVTVSTFSLNDTNDEIQYYTKTASILFDYFAMTNGDEQVSTDTDSNKEQNNDIVISKTSMLQDKPHSIIKYFMNNHVDRIEDEDDDDDDDDEYMQHQIKHENEVDIFREVDMDRVLSSTKGDSPLNFTKEDRASLLEKYMCRTTTSYVKNASILQSTATSKLDELTLNMCSYCGCADRTVVMNDGFVMCNVCATVEYVIVDHERPSYKEPPKEISYFAYKRINHLNEWLNQVQGKETTDIPEELYDKIFIEIKKRKITNMADITHTQLRSIIRKLGQNKYFEHSSHIMYRLNGILVPQLSPELEEKIRSMFKQIQVPFLKHSPPNRKNFLSYSYSIHKMLQLLDEDEYLPFFPLLKSREKLQVQDRIWKKICQENGWQFVKSI